MSFFCLLNEIFTFSQKKKNIRVSIDVEGNSGFLQIIKADNYVSGTMGHMFGTWVNYSSSLIVIWTEGVSSMQLSPI